MSCLLGLTPFIRLSCIFSLEMRARNGDRVSFPRWGKRNVVSFHFTELKKSWNRGCFREILWLTGSQKFDFNGETISGE